MWYTQSAMALIECPECGKAISSEAPSCPSCGKPNKAVRNNRRSNVQGCGCLLVLAAIGAAVVISPALAAVLGVIGLAVLVVGLLI